MDPLLLWIVALTTAGGALGVAAAGGLLLVPTPARERLLPALVSFAIGTLLGAAFLGLLPHALESGSLTPYAVALTVLIALLVFFLLEKMVVWRHCHIYDCEVHGSLPTPNGPHAANHDHGRSHSHDHHQDVVHPHLERARTAATGSLILIGDGVHNLVDGVLIAAAFLTDVKLGVVTSLAVITHEIPQELGDFAILLASGFKPARALLYNLLSGLTMVVGGVVAYFSLSFANAVVPYVLAIAAASFIYIAVADLIPGLHRRPEVSATFQQVTLIALGVLLIALADGAAHAG